MTTNFIIREALDISKKNPIADFKSIYFTPIEGISAKSIEIPKKIIEKSQLLYNFFHRLFSLGENESIKVMTFLNEQPNNRIINYKGGWNILKGYGADIELVKNRNEVKKECNNKLCFLLEGDVYASEINKISSIINNCSILFFSTDMRKINEEDIFDHNLWINSRLENGELVCFFLNDDNFPTLELVIMEKNNFFLDKINNIFS